MSYTSLGAAKGVVDDSFCGRQASAADPNDPGKGGPDAAYIFYSDGSRKLKECCPSQTWSNATIAAFMGAEALRGFNEVRVHSIADQLRNAGMKVGGTGLPAALSSRIEKALSVFASKFPRGRWAAAPGVAGNRDCSGGGNYATIVDTQSRPITASQRSIINSVPGGEPESNVYRKPSLKTLFGYTATGPVPGAWLRSFLDEFAPTLGQRLASSTKTTSLVKTTSLPLLTSSPSAPAPTSPPVLPSDPSAPFAPTSEGPSVGAKVAIGMGVVAIAGVAVYLAKRK